MEKQKRVEDSYTEQVQILNQGAINGAGRLFGGRLMEWIDVVAAVAARRHSGLNVTTMKVDSLVFKKPAYADDMLVLKAYLTYVGNTSMEICVETYIEALDGTREEINVANVTMVALDDSERPTRVPRLLIETDEQREKWRQAEERRARRSDE